MALSCWPCSCWGNPGCCQPGCVTSFPTASPIPGALCSEDFSCPAPQIQDCTRQVLTLGWLTACAVMALLACHRSLCLASELTAKGTGITTGKKTAGLEPFAGQGSTMLMLNSASSGDWQMKAEYYSINDTHSRNEAKLFAQELAAAAAL